YHLGAPRRRQAGNQPIFQTQPAQTGTTCFCARGTPPSPILPDKRTAFGFGLVRRRRCRYKPRPNVVRRNDFQGREQKETMRKKLWACAAVVAIFAVGGGVAVDYAWEHPNSFLGRCLFNSPAVAGFPVAPVNVAGKAGVLAYNGVRGMSSQGTTATW